MDIDFRLVEEAALNAWPALQQHLYDGWALRFSEEYTKRANSVNPLYPSKLDIDEKIGYCEQVYASKGYPVIFRLTEPFAPPSLDSQLALRGYQKIDPTHVMYLDLQKQKNPVATNVSFRELPLSQWLNLFTQFSGYSAAKQPIHEKMLQSIVSPCLTVALQIADEVVSLGLGVLQGSLFGLFDIVTHSDHRSKGYGKLLVSHMLRWARERGAQQAYLQVMEQNFVARSLYAKLGFEDSYAYWYRILYEYNSAV